MKKEDLIKNENMMKEERRYKDSGKKCRKDTEEEEM